MSAYRRLNSSSTKVMDHLEVLLPAESVLWHNPLQLYPCRVFGPVPIRNGACYIFICLPCR